MLNPAGSRRILCLEHVALLRSPIVRRYLANVDTLAIFEPYGAWAEGRYDPSEVDAALTRWRKALNGVTILRLTHHGDFDAMIEAGEEAIRFLEEEGTSLLKGTSVCKRLRRLLQSDAVVLALKKGMAPYLKDRILFCKLVASLAEQQDCQLLVAPAYHDGFAAIPRWLKKADGRAVIPPDLDQVSRARDRSRRVVYLLAAVAGLFLRLNRRTLPSWTPLRWRRVAPVALDWARTIAFGFSDGRNDDAGAWRSDDCLEDRAEFTPSRTVYVYDWWRFDRRLVEQWREQLVAKGARFVDTWRLRMPVEFYVRRMIPAGWQRLVWCLQSLKEPGLSKLCEVGHTLTEAYVEADLFMQYYRPRVYNVRDDYLPGHIVRTIVFNRYGCQTIGLQHGTYASLGLNPGIAYTYCNTYCAYGPIYFEQIWGRVWGYNPKQALIGVERNDYTFRAARNTARRAAFKFKYAGSKVLLWYPPSIGTPRLNERRAIEEVFRAVADFSRNHPDWTVVLHARPEERALYAPLCGSLGTGANLVVEDEFHTYELIAYVDAILAPNLSTLGIESICAGHDRVAFVNYWGAWRHPFKRYAESLVVSGPGELRLLLERWAQGDGGQDASALAAFRRDFDVGFDGMALARYKQEMRQLAGLGQAPVQEPALTSVGG